MFQSSFELTGYITLTTTVVSNVMGKVSKLFRAYGLYNGLKLVRKRTMNNQFQSSFELTGYITIMKLKS